MYTYYSCSERSFSHGGKTQNINKMSESGDRAEDTLESFEERERRKELKLQAEMEEYKQMRQSEKEKEENDIEELKRKRIDRQKQRQEEEQRMAEQRREEDARRKVEEEERKKRKAEEEEKRRREKERRRVEAEKRKGPKTPNFTIVKKEGASSTDEEVEKKAPQKTKEDLEREKQASLKTRVGTVPDMGSMTADQLRDTAKELHDQIWNVVSNMYNMMERYKRQQYDIVELQERARAMSKTKKKGIASVQVDDSYDRMNDKFGNAPPKILLCSKYERHTDQRSFDQRYKLYEELSADKPLPELLRLQAFGPGYQED
ncbi:troponin T, skeletal muscle-like isoform X2 [Dreissena polymorpha]|uniref:troponin T, skeletal muscle-like isoform X2 n=1 Tax=Dreissena polymorpha TaxID=45954 RepID=UPI00226484CF|nr:troponin T, skeletal muscle-like isoform X2 [Dreissena polymorpha]XP_052268348.1 troponin T, skeletal muscle-like isoform X2 [Dreissena polymorpha]